jgi:predicted small lipoprotein YifL
MIGGMGVMAMRLRTVILVSFAAALVAGCGARGRLEPPPAAQAGPAAPSTTPEGEAPAQAAPPEPPRRFFLDFLL